MHVALSVLARKWLTEGNAAKAGQKVPALVWQAPPGAASEGPTWDVTEVGRVMTRPTASDPLIYMVEKTSGNANPFAMGVTVGRVESNDVIVDDASVSRFHAWFQHDDKAREWMLCDADSKNGTWCDNKKLKSGQKVKIDDGSVVRFGDAEMKFLLPETLFSFVKMMATKS